MHIRYPFAGGFAMLVLLAGYFGLSDMRLPATNDKLLHFLIFFLLTLTLYWAVELPRRLLMKLVLGATAGLSVASEFLQGALDNGRDFDAADIAANLIGSVLALGICQWYHKRMLERRRRRKLEGYGLVDGVEHSEDIELGEASSSRQEMGVIPEEEEEGEDEGEAWDDMGGGPGEDIGAVDGGGKDGPKQNEEQS